ncbi:MAG: tetratricopeptide repeat protein, partial [Pseudomonadota bacterium]
MSARNRAAQTALAGPLFLCVCTVRVALFARTIRLLQVFVFMLPVAFRHFFVAVVAAVSVQMVAPGVAVAQEAAATAAAQAVQARRDQLFAAMLNDPSNLDIAFEYALLSARVGDFEGAIATLERMLIYAPNLPRIQLELGVLYYRIGATDTARQYLEAAKRAQAPQAVRERVDTFLGQIDRQERRFTVSGSFHTGLRYQSNATASPDDAVVNINGFPVRLDQDARAQADGNAFAIGDVHFVYDLRNQGDLIEASVISYNSQFFDVQRLNLNLIEAQLGPSFSMGRFGFRGTQLGVYAIGGATALDHEVYTTQYGGGAKLRARLSDNVLWDTRGEVRVVNYQDSPSYPSVRLQTGEEYLAQSTLTAGLDVQTVAQATLGARI